MTNQSNYPPDEANRNNIAEQNKNNLEHNQTSKIDENKSKERIVDPRDLVYSGGFDRDPQEILGNPAVAPEMIQEGRDLRVDLFRETEEANPDKET